MPFMLHEWTATFYLLAGVVAWLGLALRSPRLERHATVVLGVGTALNVAALAMLHQLDPPPPLTDLPTAASFAACVGTLFFLLLQGRARLAGLTVLVAPVAFVSVFYAALRIPHGGVPTFESIAPWAHSHVLLASAGLACLAMSGVAGFLFLVEHRRIKAKRPLDPRFPLPSLEALDRVNLASLAVGFPLLTLGLVTGLLWVHAVRGTFVAGGQHEVWLAVSWVVYAVLVAVRFAARQGARPAAASAVAAFGFLTFAVIGVGLFA
jgi:ABC-type uncharacterized transport system permease subunit